MIVTGLVSGPGPEALLACTLTRYTPLGTVATKLGLGQTFGDARIAPAWLRAISV